MCSAWSLVSTSMGGRCPPLLTPPPSFQNPNEDAQAASSRMPDNQVWELGFAQPSPAGHWGLAAPPRPRGVWRNLTCRFIREAFSQRPLHASTSLPCPGLGVGCVPGAYRGGGGVEPAPFPAAVGGLCQQAPGQKGGWAGSVLSFTVIRGFVWILTPSAASPAVLCTYLLCEVMWTVRPHGPLLKQSCLNKHSASSRRKAVHSRRRGECAGQ